MRCCRDHDLLCEAEVDPQLAAQPLDGADVLLLSESLQPLLHLDQIMSHNSLLSWHSFLTRV